MFYGFILSCIPYLLPISPGLSIWPCLDMGRVRAVLIPIFLCCSESDLFFLEQPVVSIA